MSLGRIRDGKALHPRTTYYEQALVPRMRLFLTYQRGSAIAPVDRRSGYSKNVLQADRLDLVDRGRGRRRGPELRPVLCRCSSEGVANSSALRAVALVPDALPCDLGKTRRRDFRQVLRYRAASLANECEVFGVTHAKVANRKVKPNIEPFAYGQPAIHRLRQQTCNLLAGRSHLPDPGN